jgi:hypothetical protein
MVDGTIVAEAEVQRPGRLREIASGTLHLSHEHLLAAVKLHHGADGIAIASRALQA